MFRKLFFVLASLGASFQAVEAASLCQPKETIVFSCSTGKKIVSVCASATLTATTGYLQYRFGVQPKPELTFPEDKSHPSKFATSGTIMYSGGNATYMRFKNGAYSYVTYTGEGRGWAKEGLAVEKNGKLLKNILCKNGFEGEMGRNFFAENEIPEDTIGFEIP